MFSYSFNSFLLGIFYRSTSVLFFLYNYPYFLTVYHFITRYYYYYVQYKNNTQSISSD